MSGLVRDAKKRRRIRPVRRSVIALVITLVFTATPAASASAPEGTGGLGRICVNQEIPVSLTGNGPKTYHLFGRLCYPPNRVPRAVQLLVSGFTYNHLYWDVPGFGDQYSYVAHAVAAGYATFAVDPIGTGSSSRPPGSQVTIDAGAATIHQVVQALRAGVVLGHSFGQVIYVGHSLGSKTGWVEISRYHDVDAFVQTASVHAFNKKTLADFGDDVYNASDDPRFAALGLDPGYVTTKPGTRKIFYYLPATDPEVLRFDERHKDVGLQAQSAGTRELVDAPPDEAVTRRIDVPVLSVVGQYDALDCGEPGGLDCSDPQQVQNFESRYYSDPAQLTVAVIPGAGHDLNLHRNAPETNQVINRWIQSILPPPKEKF